jgi:adenosylcobinamide kinase / adenosylcobinamide-phosphate guanylyltransferase
MRTLFIGGARSGKSALALRWASERASSVCALVTGTESDPEMAARIAAHRRERPPHWRVREEPVRIGQALREEALRLQQSRRESAAVDPGEVILIDCLTLWISNCLWAPGCEAADLPQWQRERADFLDALTGCNADVLIVTNEVGTGIVPSNPAARMFRDEQGWLNQAVAATCDEVYFVTAGLPMCLKPHPTTPGHTTTRPR